MNLEQYKTLADDHWKEFLPTYYQQLLKAKKLPEALERAAKQTDVEMQSALDSGVPRDQAWEQIRGRYLLLEPESESQEGSPRNPGLELLKEINDATQRIYDEL